MAATLPEHTRAASLAQVSSGRMPAFGQEVPVTADNISVGLRVQRGAGWSAGDQDGGAGRRGTVLVVCSPSGVVTPRSAAVEAVGLLPPGNAVVQWDSRPDAVGADGADGADGAGGDSSHMARGRRCYYSLAPDAAGRSLLAISHNQVPAQDSEYHTSFKLTTTRLTQLKRGKELLKFGRRGQPARRFFRVANNEKVLLWVSPKKMMSATRIELHTVDRVQPGQTTSVFLRFNGRYADAAKHSFSLIYEGSTRSLDIVCEDEEDYALWLGGLEVLVKRAKGRRNSGREDDPESVYLRQMWHQADLDNSGTLDVREVVKLLHVINCKVSRVHVKSLFREHDTDNNGVLCFEEFTNLLQHVRKRPEVDHIWASMAGDGLKMSSTVFRFFLVHEQKEGEDDLTTAAVEALVKVLEPSSGGHFLLQPAFQRYLASPVLNSAMHPVITAQYQDMTRPINHYYIASSHNTYLEGDQLNSASSVSRYISDFSVGCRCVELDCWDGTKGDMQGEPIIYHGGTLTGKILFSEVVKAVKAFGFVRSAFPVVLSLEMHCSLEGQERIAAILQRELGGTLFVPEEEQVVAWEAGAPLPSPAQLQGRVLLKGKANPLTEGSAVDDETESDDDEEKARATAAKAAAGGAAFDPPSPSSGKRNSRGSLGNLFTSQGAKKKKNGKKIHPDLSRLIFFRTSHFKSFDRENLDSTPRTNYMSSFGENKTGRLVEHDSANFVRYTQSKIARVYPGGHRIDSSNLDPVKGWTVGAQMVALNYQTRDNPWKVNMGMFQQNGGCGYVLKPAFLNDPSQSFSVSGPFPQTPRNFRITLRVISAQQLPKPQGKTTGEIIDPFCQIVVNGVPQDCRTVRTATVENNGINPLWDEMFDMPLKCPHLAHLLFNVKDGENALRSDRAIGFCSVPVMTLREGYRMLPIYSNETATELEFASLFVHIAFSHARAELLTPTEIEMENRPFDEAAAAAREADAVRAGSPRSGDPSRRLQSEASVRVAAHGALTRTGSERLPAGSSGSPSVLRSMTGAMLSSSDDDEGETVDDMYPKTIRVWPLYALGLSRQADGPQSVPDPFVVLFLDDNEVGKTNTVNNSTAPVWTGQYFDMELPLGLRPSDSCHLRLEVYDYDMFSRNEFLGEVVLGADLLSRGHKSASQFMLRPKVGRSSKYVQGSLAVAITPTTVQTLSADQTRTFASKRDRQAQGAEEHGHGAGGLLDSVVGVVGDGISSIGNAMHSAVFGEDPKISSSRALSIAAEHPERAACADPYGAPRQCGGMGLAPVKSFRALEDVARTYVAEIFRAAGVHVDQARNAASMAARDEVAPALPAPEHRLAPQECFRLHAPLLSNGAAMPEEVWLELKEPGVSIVHRAGAAPGAADTELAVWPWAKIRKCVGNVQDPDPEIMEMLMVTVEDMGTYAFETADGVKMALAMSAWKDALLGVAPRADAFDQHVKQTKVELSHLYLSSEALSHSETARRTSVVSGRRVSAPVLITRMVEGSARTALAAPATIAEGEEEHEQAKRRDSQQFEM